MPTSNTEHHPASGAQLTFVLRSVKVTFLFADESSANSRRV